MHPFCKWQITAIKIRVMHGIKLPMCDKTMMQSRLDGVVRLSWSRKTYGRICGGS